MITNGANIRKKTEKLQSSIDNRRLSDTKTICSKQSFCLSACVCVSFVKRSNSSSTTANPNIIFGIMLQLEVKTTTYQTQKQPSLSSHSPLVDLTLSGNESDTSTGSMADEEIPLKVHFHRWIFLTVLKFVFTFATQIQNESFRFCKK